MTISSIGRRVALVGSLAMLVALLPLAASAQPTGPVLRDLQVNEELEASESVQASILWSQEAFADDSADEVLIATDADFADALASGVLQGDAPLLYTDGDSVDDLVLEEIERLGATSATILGGEVAVSSDVEDALTDAGLEVSRLEGESRIETAVAIAEQELEGDTVFLARAFGTETDPTQAFADNLALGGWAADSGIPVLLTQTDVLTGNTRAFLEANTDVTNVTVVGGEAAISEDVVAELEELGLTVERVEGENRFGTAVAIAEARGLAAADVDQAVFVEGQADDAYINGLAAAAYSAANDAPILLTNGDSVPPETQDYLGDEADFSITDEPGETAGVLGTNVSADAAQALADALGAELETVQLAGPEEPVDENTGIVIDTDNATYYTFVGEGADAETQVVIDAANDDFFVDGTPATAGVFITTVDICDIVTYTEGGTEDGEGDVHELDTTQDCSDITSGTVGDVTLGASFWIVEPVTGTPLQQYTYGGATDLYTVDGATATIAQFDGDINEGDSVEVTDDGTTTTFALMNEVVSGTAGDVNLNAGVWTQFTIGGLGDDFAGGDVYEASAAAAPGTEVFIVDGEDADYAAFEAALSDGDAVSYQRQGDEETFTVGNEPPPVEEGLVEDVITPLPAAANGDGGTVGYIPAGSDTADTITWTNTAQFIVDGVVTTELEFEQDLSAGDAISYRPADAGTSTSERVILTNQDLAGVFVDGDGTADDGVIVIEVYTTDGGLLSVYAPGGSDRYFLDGVEVTSTDFIDEVEDATFDDGYTIQVVEGIVGNEIRVETPDA